MIAGLLREQITIYKPTNVQGEIVWAKVRDTRAQVLMGTGRRTVSNDEVFYPDLRTFRVRIYHPIDPTWRIEFAGTMYRIVSIFPDTQNQLTEIVGEKVNG